MEYLMAQILSERKIQQYNSLEDIQKNLHKITFKTKNQTSITDIKWNSNLGVKFAACVRLVSTLDSSHTFDYNMIVLGVTQKQVYFLDINPTEEYHMDTGKIESYHGITCFFNKIDPNANLLDSNFIEKSSNKDAVKLIPLSDDDTIKLINSVISHP